MTSLNMFLCEECGYTTSAGHREEDIFFVSQEYQIHFHKTCFLSVLEENQSRQSRTCLQLLGEFWKEVEEHGYLLAEQNKLREENAHKELLQTQIVGTIIPKIEKRKNKLLSH